MNKMVRERLEAHWERHGKPKSGFVFVTEHGTPFLHRNASRDLIKFLKKQGITDITPHQLRHTAASMLAHYGVHPSTARELLGHTDVDMTLKVYTHAMDEAKRAAVEWTDELLSD
ncbi:MAG TPA: tyrosine-type recombinase/integrase [Thermomicrobiales bacterium]|nr:tyrosine-type recombinase/integrase [Thermomicrobiales bacterium]